MQPQHYESDIQKEVNKTMSKYNVTTLEERCYIVEANSPEEAKNLDDVVSQFMNSQEVTDVCEIEEEELLGLEEVSDEEIASDIENENKKED